ncbi:MAG TPA: hypothetical protein VG347_16090 [Verrucomicrobiae bacterium]|nr:hypothetical protein [Verrucomicrobiae bacterium]
MSIKIRKKRDYRPHSEAIHGAKVLLRLSEEEKKGCFYQWMGSLLLCAFAYEGYLNFLGRKLFPSWEDFERQMSWQSKTKLIADHISLKLNEGAEPFQAVKQLFKFRDQIAHPKPKEMEEEFETTNEKLESVFYENTKSDEEKFCSQENAKLCIERVEQMMELLFNQARIKHESVNKYDRSFILNAPFVKSGQSGSAHSG